MDVGFECSSSSVHVISDLQLDCTGIARGSRGSAGILFSCHFPQLKENRFAGTAMQICTICRSVLLFIEVDPTTVATDSFMTNVHLILLRFAEPFMDAQYTKVNAVVRLLRK
jgi:hypothetical protein